MNEKERTIIKYKNKVVQMADYRGADSRAPLIWVCPYADSYL